MISGFTSIEDFSALKMIRIERTSLLAHTHLHLYNAVRFRNPGYSSDEC